MTDETQEPKASTEAGGLVEPLVMFSAEKPKASGWYELRHRGGEIRRYLIKEVGFIGGGDKLKSVLFAHLDGGEKGSNIYAEANRDEFNGEWRGPLGDGPNKIWLLPSSET